MTTCGACGSLGPSERGYSKYGQEDEARPLPAATSALVERASNLSGGRGDALLECAACGAFFHYRQDYEYLVNGSEDEETLTRISAEEAKDLARKIG